MFIIKILFFCKKIKKGLRKPGIEPGSQAWEAHMITTTLTTLDNSEKNNF